MKPSNTVIRKRGRPATGTDPLVALRFPTEMLAKIDNWAKRDSSPSRSEAIRRLVELGLKAKG